MAAKTVKFPKIISFPDMGVDFTIDKTSDDEAKYLVFEDDNLIAETATYSEAYAVVMEAAEGAMA